MMMQLGAYQFELNTARYQTLVREIEFLWNAKGRFGQRPSLQSGGIGEEKITVSGVVFGAWRGGIGQLDAMRAEGAKRKPLLLVSSGWQRGRNVFGYWVLTRVRENQSHIDQRGSPEKQEYTLELSFYGERFTHE